jgi:hypothetical protein
MYSGKLRERLPGSLQPLNHQVPTSAAIGVHTAGLTLRVQEDTLKSRMQERGLSDKRSSSYLLLTPPGDTTAGGGQNTLLSTELPQEK